MTAIKLTKRVVDAAEPRVARYVVFDSEIRGFGLRVFPSGSKSWIFEYRAGEGGRRAAKKRMTIGAADDFTPDEARKIADKLRARAKVGEDPAKAKSDHRASLTIAEVSVIFLRDHVAAKRKGRTEAHYADILNRIVVPAIGSLKAKDVTRADIARLHLSWKRTKFQANRMLAVIGSMFSFASNTGLVPPGTNPVQGVEKYPEHRRERFLSSVELARLGDAIREAETTGIPWQVDPEKQGKHLPKEQRATVIGEHAAAAIRLLLFTGARLREVLHLQWQHVDAERGLLLLPDSKTGQKAVVLNAPALAVLTNLKRVGRYVIAGESAGTEDEKPRSDLKRPWTAVSKRAGLTGVRIHDIRHTFASFGAGGGLGLPIIGKLLGHVEARTTQRYAHLDNDPLRRAANSIGASVASALGESDQGADIVSFPRQTAQ
ncbi:tyrosine-type recombinase/integrase [Bosea beijingensis]